jgi:hypothetical protein
LPNGWRMTAISWTAIVTRFLGLAVLISGSIVGKPSAGATAWACAGLAVAAAAWAAASTWWVVFQWAEHMCRTGHALCGWLCHISQYAARWRVTPRIYSCSATCGFRRSPRTRTSIRWWQSF